MTHSERFFDSLAEASDNDDVDRYNHLMAQGLDDPDVDWDGYDYENARAKYRDRH